MKILVWVNSIKLANLWRWCFAAFNTIVLIRFFVFPAQAQLAWNTNTVSRSLPITALSVQEEFCFTNIGITTAHLSNTYSTCDCTAVLPWPSRTIPSGANGKIIVKINVAEQTGILRKTVYVNADESTYQLNAIIKIPDLVSLSSRSLDFERTNIVEQTIIFSNLLETPIQLQPLMYDSEIGKPVQCTVKTITPGRVFALQIKPAPSKEPYNIQFNAVVEQRETGIKKYYRFKANVN